LQVTREGKRIRTRHLEVRALASLLHHPRVGFIVPRYKHSAVDRNRLKRRLREVTRTQLLPRLAPQDLVVRTRPETYGATLDQLTAELSTVLQRLPQRPSD